MRTLEDRDAQRKVCQFESVHHYDIRKYLDAASEVFPALEMLCSNVSRISEDVLFQKAFAKIQRSQLH